MDVVDRALASLDDESARRAAPAIDTLLGPSDDRMPLATLSRLELQDFLWGKLPTRFLTDDRDHHEIAWALGDLLEALGLEKYAALCRDRRTHEILAAWHRDPAEGERLGNEAGAASGVLPPDTPSLTFAQVMGPIELNTYLDIGAALEKAIDEGRLDRTSRGFERERIGLVEHLLQTPYEDGQTPLAAVRRERAHAWAAGFRGDPTWLTAVLPLLEQEAAMPENVELSLAPARALLEAVGDGLTLTGAGYLPPATVVELNDHFRWSDVVGRSPKREADLPSLRFLREHLVAQRLLLVRKGSLVVSSRGRACLSDPEVFWDALTALGPRWGDFEQEVLAVAAALLLAAPDVDHLSAHVEARIAGRWKGGNLERDVNWVYLDWYRVGLTLGWWEARHGRWLDRLSARGVSAAARAFWSVAAAAQPA